MVMDIGASTQVTAVINAVATIICVLLLLLKTFVSDIFTLPFEQTKILLY